MITYTCSHCPKRANIRLLPSELKLQVHNHYDYYKFKVAQDNEIQPEVKVKFNKILDSVEKYMMADDYSDKVDEFIKFTKYLDNQRQQSIIDVVPQYKELFDV